MNILWDKIIELLREKYKQFFLENAFTFLFACWLFSFLVGFFFQSMLWSVVIHLYTYYYSEYHFLFLEHFLVEEIHAG